jgi:hypothetical protein
VTSLPSTIPVRGGVAFVVLRDPGEVPDDLAVTAVRNVGRSFAPTVEVVASLSKATNGTIMRRAIRARYLGVPAADVPAGPVMSTERPGMEVSIPVRPLDLGQVAKTWESSAKALNSNALPAGSSRNIVHCSPACPAKRT